MDGAEVEYRCAEIAGYAQDGGEDGIDDIGDKRGDELGDRATQEKPNRESNYCLLTDKTDKPSNHGYSIHVDTNTGYMCYT